MWTPMNDVNNHLVIDCPMYKIIKYQALNHKVLTGSVIYTSTVLNETISVPS